MLIACIRDLFEVVYAQKKKAADEESKAEPATITITADQSATATETSTDVSVFALTPTIHESTLILAKMCTKLSLRLFVSSSISASLWKGLM